MTQVKEIVSLTPEPNVQVVPWTFGSEGPMLLLVPLPDNLRSNIDRLVKFGVQVHFHISYLWSNFELKKFNGFR